MAPTSPSKIVEPAPAKHAPLIVWRIVDGKPGHDNQSLGLVSALSRLAHTVCLDIPAVALKYGLINFLSGKYPPGSGLNKPDLILGAGHRTHLSVLCAKRACGGYSVILMKPSLPTVLFDCCLIPDHDAPAAKDNIIITQGMITAISPSTQHDPARGLFLIGGPSRHYGWDDAALLRQAETIINMTPGISWAIADSRRTPFTTRVMLNNLAKNNCQYYSCENTGPGWVAAQLASAGNVWVSADSMSMIYESLTSGAPTGVLNVPQNTANKVSDAIYNLTEQGLVTTFENWQRNGQMNPPRMCICEADRCARLLLEKLS